MPSRTYTATSDTSAYHPLAALFATIRGGGGRLQANGLRSKGVSKRVWLSLVAAASGGAGPSVLAQFALKPDMPISVVGQRNFETDPALRTQRPSVSEDDVKAMVEMLHLSEMQRASVLELHQGYVAEYMRQVAVLHKLVEAVDKARAAGADNLQTVIREHWLGYFSLRETSDKAEKSLLADLEVAS